MSNKLFHTTHFLSPNSRDNRPEYSRIYSLAGLSLTVILFAVLIAGCDQSTSPRQTGNIIGNVEHIDQWLRPIPDKSGITVSLEGTSYSDSTNREGRYELDDVAPGIYTLLFSKEEFGTNKIPFFDFVGGGDIYVEDPSNPFGNIAPLVGKIPQYTVEVDSLAPPDAGLARFRVLLSETVPDSGAAMVVLFQGDNPDLSAEPLKHNFFQVFFVPAGYNGFLGDAIVDADPGVNRYLRFYPGAGTAIFPDPEARSDNWAWASLGTPTEVKKVTVPADNGEEDETTSERRPKTSIGAFVLYGREGNVRDRIPISAEDSREDIAEKYHTIRDQIPGLRAR